MGIRTYYRLIKPGIVYGNLMHALIGMGFGVLAVDALEVRYIGALLGVMAIIASACIVNNYIDRTIDAKMKRTKKRGFVTGEVRTDVAAVIALGLLGAGAYALLVWGNGVSLALGVVAYIWYVGVYALAKRTTIHSTLIGAVPGALPGVAGYTIATGALDTTALMIGGVLAVWQLPHFYAIAIFRQQEYERAGLPVLPSFVDEKTMHRLIYWLIGLFGVLAMMMVYVSQAPLWSAGIFGLLTVWWVVYGMRTSAEAGYNAWARRIFGGSLLVSLGSMALIGCVVVLQLVGLV